MGWLRSAVFWGLAAVVAVRCGGLVARQVRDQQLDWLLRTGIAALHQRQLTAFLDWSSLLGQWRQAGFLWDEEDCDLGVIVPDQMNETDVAAALAAGFGPTDHVTIITEPGAVFAEPVYSRLHLDLYLVRERAGQLHPMWPPPSRTDSHAAFIYPRPFSGVAQLNGWPVPKNTESYLAALFGYLGTGAAYSSETGLYYKMNSTEGSSGLQLSRVGYMLSRDIYFMTIMMPLSQAFRKGVEDQCAGAVRWMLSFFCKGSPDTVSFRDC